MKKKMKLSSGNFSHKALSSPLFKAKTIKDKRKQEALKSKKAIDEALKDYYGD